MRHEFWDRRLINYFPLSTLLKNWDEVQKHPGLRQIGDGEVQIRYTILVIRNIFEDR